jgi:hypothetical protein
MSATTMRGRTATLVLGGHSFCPVELRDLFMPHLVQGTPSPLHQTVCLLRNAALHAAHPHDNVGCQGTDETFGQPRHGTSRGCVVRIQPAPLPRPHCRSHSRWRHRRRWIEIITWGGKVPAHNSARVRCWSNRTLPSELISRECPVAVIRPSA